MGEEELDQIDLEDGRWNATTLGQFIALMVDNVDIAAVWRVAKDEPPDDEGQFVRHLELVLIPNGMVRKTLQTMYDGDDGLQSIHKHLSKMLDAKVIT